MPRCSPGVGSSRGCNRWLGHVTNKAAGGAKTKITIPTVTRLKHFHIGQVSGCVVYRDTYEEYQHTRGRVAGACQAINFLLGGGFGRAVSAEHRDHTRQQARRRKP